MSADSIQNKSFSTSPQIGDYDHLSDSLRPQSFEDFVGQNNLCKNLQTFLASAIKRQQPMDHVLLSGPPGLGKTTLAMLLAKTTGTGFHLTSGAAIARAGELAALLTKLKPHDFLFIDEIHRLNRHVEEVLYPALEDRKLDLIVGEGAAARSVRLSLSPFTLVAATTRQGLLSRPLRDRFGILGQFVFYTQDELKTVLIQSAKRYGLVIDKKGLSVVANCARGTPRIALRLLRRLRDFAVTKGCEVLDEIFVEKALKDLGIDPEGLDALDYRYLSAIRDQFQGGPVGIETLSATLFEEKSTLEDVVEPFLMQKGFVQRTPQGRLLTQTGRDHLTQSSQRGLQHA